MPNLIIPEELKKSVKYDDDKILIRIEGKEVSEKHEEFINIITGVFGKFDMEDWKISKIEPILSSKIRQCICSKHISWLYFIQHKMTNQIVMVGSECIKKISEKLYFEVIERACKNCGDKIDKRTISGKEDLCDFCFELRKEKECKEREERRRKIYAEYARIEAERVAKLPKCEDCGIWMPEETPLWKTKCMSCWKISRAAEKPKPKSKCESCGQYNIPEEKSEWMKLCYSCWKASLPYSKHSGSR